MKTFLFPLFLLVSSSFTLYGQLNITHNYYRAGDELIKQQVSYKDPIGSGPNMVWDFSQLETMNEQYILTYDLPPLEGDSIYIVGNKRYYKNKISSDQLIVGTEHNTLYYYYLKSDTLLQIGHENPTIKLDYDKPMPIMFYPLNYGDVLTKPYSAKGLYSGTVDIHTYGQITTYADAYGKLILPSRDTLNSVLRVTTIQTIHYTHEDQQEETLLEETTINKGNQLETHRWYSKGYRYPVFETVKSTSLHDNSELFSTAFFYPPQDHFYLDTDPENLAILDEMWKEIEEKANKQDKTNTFASEGILTCNIYPNPVESYMYLDYNLKENAKISFEIYSMDGRLVKGINFQNKLAGTYSESLDCTNLNPQIYVLRMTANNTIINQIIIKK